MERFGGLSLSETTHLTIDCNSHIAGDPPACLPHYLPTHLYSATGSPSVPGTWCTSIMMMKDKLEKYTW